MVIRSFRRAVFLDRDGVINRTEVRDGKPYAPRQLKDFRLLPLVPAAVQTLRDIGFAIIVVTNQPDIGNSLVSQSVVDAMHEKLRTKIGVDDILTCPHRQSDGCDCRKPKPGMLFSAADRHRIDLSQSFLVGDRISDILSGNAAGCYTVFIRRGAGYPENRNSMVPANAIARSLPSAVRHILSKLNSHANPLGDS